MSISELKAKIVELAIQRKHVSFIEIMNSLPEEKGTFRLFHPSFENVIFWAGMSYNLVAAIAELIEEKSINFVRTDPRLTYAADGGGLDLPLATSIRKYQNPHWFPVLLDKYKMKALS